MDNKIQNGSEANNKLEKRDVIKTGTVNCYCLNVREKPLEWAKVLGIVKFGTKVTVNVTKSTDVFYKVSLPGGIDGFCMKQFITV